MADRLTMALVFYPAVYASPLILLLTEEAMVEPFTPVPSPARKVDLTTTGLVLGRPTP